MAGDSSISTNPPEDDIPDQGTFGVELEFLVMQCPKAKRDSQGQLVIMDPHPNEPRWLSKQMADWELKDLNTEIQNGNENMYLYTAENGTISYIEDEDGYEKRDRYSRTKLTRVLRDRGLVVIKWPEPEINREERYINFVPINDFDESEDSDDEREEDFPNSSRLGDFSSNYTWHPGMTANENTERCLLQWEHDFEAYHDSKNLKIYRTRDIDIERLVENQCTVTPERGSLRLQDLQHRIRERLTAKRIESKQDREDERNRQVDPLHVEVQGLRQQYKAWTVTIDMSVDGNGMTKERYANTDNADPLGEYHFFGAEVVSPVLPMGDERSREAVRVACGALRDALRCHKPMHVSTGLHVHMGNAKGWTLFQAKKFATFWFLTESTILKLHRVDRDLDEKWCAKIRGGSRLWRALFSPSPERREEDAPAMPNSHPRMKVEFGFQMLDHVPASEITQQERLFLHYVWHYDSINFLDFGLGENTVCRTGIKWRIRGRNSSLEKQFGEHTSPGTIEARIMHGTLDADHINNWVRLLEHIVHVVRDYSATDYRDALRRFVQNRTLDQLLDVLQVSDDLKAYWRDPKRRDSEDKYWEYPDKDLVDWTDPFNVPGYKATHGAFWD
ncbi:hypothetical protein F4678DRAFT_475506 [Xylaria arbuscula]|nr:hypothetical protein F4678DRAFT_475506 [Xylaria arbuscula]